jgi:hypothetical protein
LKRYKKFTCNKKICVRIVDEKIAWKSFNWWCKLRLDELSLINERFASHPQSFISSLRRRRRHRASPKPTFRRTSGEKILKFRSKITTKRDALYMCSSMEVVDTSDVHFVEGQRRSLLLSLGGYTFVKNRSTEEKTCWICSRKVGKLFELVASCSLKLLAEPSEVFLSENQCNIDFMNWNWTKTNQAHESIEKTIRFGIAMFSGFYFRWFWLKFWL